MFPKIDKKLFRQMFSKDINTLMIYVYKFYIKDSFLHIITNEMISYLNMFSL